MSSVSDETITTTDDSSFSLDHGDQPMFLAQNHRIDTKETIPIVRINALKNLQIAYNRLEGRYLKAVNQLEYEFHQQCSNLFERRSTIINGKYEPTDDECRLKPDLIVDHTEKQSTINNQRGIPSFWLQTLKQVSIIADMIEDWDEPILKCLCDIKLQLHVQPVVGFTLEFHFNEQCQMFFKNRILTKFYQLQIEPDDELLYYEGTAIVRSIGCQIDWIDSKTNVTMNGISGERQSSFFNFFTSPIATGNHVDDFKLATDFEIGHFIRENLIPKAVLYYTGEALDDEYEFSDDDEHNSDEQRNLSSEDEGGEGEHL